MRVKAEQLKQARQKIRNSRGMGENKDRTAVAMYEGGGAPN